MVVHAMLPPARLKADKSIKLEMSKSKLTDG